MQNVRALFDVAAACDFFMAGSDCFLVGPDKFPASVVLRLALLPLGEKYNASPIEPEIREFFSKHTCIDIQTSEWVISRPMRIYIELTIHSVKI